MVGRTRLGELLTRNNTVSQQQLLDALLAQVIYGRRLGTNLVELFCVDLDDLAQALATQHDLPPALNDHFSAAEPSVQKRLTAEQAQMFYTVPLGQVASGIAVAVRDPISARGVAKLSQLLGGPIEMRVCSELRIAYQLERIYNVRRTNELLRVRQATTDTDDAGAERRRYVNTLATTEQAGTQLANTSSNLGRITLKRIHTAAEKSEPHPIAIDDEQPTAGPNLRDTLRAIRRAPNRDTVADHVVRAMTEGLDQCLDAGIVMVLRNGVALGWKGFVRDAEDFAVNTIAVPLDVPSMFLQPLQTRTAVFGDVANATYLDRQVWTALRATSRPTIGIVPIELSGQVVCLLYGHALTPGALDSAASSVLQYLAKAMRVAFTRLIEAAHR